MKKLEKCPYCSGELLHDEHKVIHCKACGCIWYPSLKKDRHYQIFAHKEITKVTDLIKEHPFQMGYL